MSKNAEETHQHYSRSIRQWGKLLAEVSRRLQRELERKGIKCTLRHRIKTAESLLEKRSLRGSAEQGCAEQIADLLGLRVTVPFLENVDAVVDVIRKSFDVHEIERKAEKLSYKEFAYDSVHLVVIVPSDGVEFPAGCLASSCEIQVRTVLQDAWAEVEHELIYKSRVEFPDSTIRKKLAALNANLTLSDIIFQEIRDRQQELRRWGSERFQKLERKAASVGPSDLPEGLSFDSSKVAPSSNGETVRDGEQLQQAMRSALEAHQRKRFAVAVRLYSEALEMHPRMDVRAVIYNFRGLAHFMMRDERAALNDFEASVGCDSRHYPAMNNCALVWRRFGHVSKSLEEFDRSLSVERRQPEVHVMRAETLLEGGDPAAALEAARSALAIDPADPEAERLVLRAEQLLRASRKASARRP